MAWTYGDPIALSPTPGQAGYTLYYSGGSYKPSGGPLSAPTADPTKTAVKSLSPSPDTATSTPVTPTNTGTGLPTDPLQMLGQLYSQGFGGGGGGTGVDTTALANQLAALSAGAGQPQASPVNWTAILVLAAIGFGVWYYMKHKRKAA